MVEPTATPKTRVGPAIPVVAASAAQQGRGHLIFVYGTLRASFGNWKYFLEGNSDRHPDGITRPEYTMLNMGMYPGVVDGGSTAIVGEVYGVDDYVLSGLDRLEGHPNFYVRTPITLQDGREVQMYILNKQWQSGVDSRYAITSGDWKRRS